MVDDQIANLKDLVVRSRRVVADARRLTNEFIKIEARRGPDDDAVATIGGYLLLVQEAERAVRDAETLLVLLEHREPSEKIAQQPTK